MTIRANRRTSLAPATLLAVIIGLAAASSGLAAEAVVATVPGADFQVGSTPIVQTVDFTTDLPVNGVGFTARWSAVVADTKGGVAPWSLDLEIDVTAPDGTSQLAWAPIGGDRTIASYPLQDATSGFARVGGTGAFEWTFSSISGPWIAGLSDVSYHLTTTVTDVVEVREGSTATGPLWDRPFFIAGISGLGPVVYHATTFRVPVSGLYTFDCVVPVGNNFTYLYRNTFDADQPLVGLLDYGLGNGSAPNGTPQGTSLIEALLLRDETYTFVVSQWSATQAGQPYTNTITGPGAIITCVGDLDGSGAIGFGDLTALLATYGACPAIPDPCLADFDRNGSVGFTDLTILLANWGGCADAS